MDFNWKFSQTDTSGADKTEFNDSKWRTLNLQHDWSIDYFGPKRQLLQIPIGSTMSIIFDI